MAASAAKQPPWRRWSSRLVRASLTIGSTGNAPGFGAIVRWDPASSRPRRMRGFRAIRDHDRRGADARRGAKAGRAACPAQSRSESRLTQSRREFCPFVKAGVSFRLIRMLLVLGSRSVHEIAGFPWEQARGQTRPGVRDLVGGSNRSPSLAAGVELAASRRACRSGAPRSSSAAPVSFLFTNVTGGTASDSAPGSR